MEEKNTSVATLMELVDIGDLKSPGESRAGSTPAGGIRVDSEGFASFTSGSSCCGHPCYRGPLTVAPILLLTRGITLPYIAKDYIPKDARYAC